MLIGYLGPKGTFTYSAAVKICNNKSSLKEFPTIFSLLKAVDKRIIDQAVVPIENSVEGSVNPTLDTIAFSTDIHITGEYIFKISQNLLAKPGTSVNEIKEIISMGQAIGQCQEMLNTEFPGVSIQFANSTAEAALAVSQGNGDIACIASAESAKLYGLEILVSDCNDRKNNCTKFVTVEKNPIFSVTDHDKSSIVFLVNNTPGSLYEVLKCFSDSNINMTKIESRPSKKALGEYAFFVDIDGNADNPTVYFALDNVRKKSRFYKFLGSYASAEII